MTALNQLIELLDKEILYTDIHTSGEIFMLKRIKSKCTELLAIEKQQIVDAFEKGYTSSYTLRETGEQYYNSLITPATDKL